jgi:hypothetical protein
VKLLITALGPFATDREWQRCRFAEVAGNAAVISWRDHEVSPDIQSDDELLLDHGVE